MIEKGYETPCGTIHYWVSDDMRRERPTLVLLPGLTADHRLFERQIQHFEGKENLLVWDAPGHGESWPFALNFELKDKATWLDEILVKEGIHRPVIVGQSMGGYVGQMYAELFPKKLAGFISIDSAPLQREYTPRWESWLLKHMTKVYLYYPWKALVNAGTKGVATTKYGRELMRQMMMTYEGDQRRYAELAGHGYRMLGEAIEADLPYQISCPCLLIAGTKDHAGECIRYNKQWHERTGCPIYWIKGAGHNSNTDAPKMVNRLIEEFLGYMK